MKNILKAVLFLEFVPCHRMPSRSFIFCGKQFPICARCAAILAGYLFIPLLFAFDVRLPIWLAAAMNAPMVADGWTQLKKWRESTNILRAATGLLSGFGQAALVVSGSLWLAEFVQRHT